MANKKRIKWSNLKEEYLAIHNINGEIINSRQRIGDERLQQWVKSKLNYFNYKEEHFIKAEIRYYRISGPIYNEFMKRPYNYVNTCTARMSKALHNCGVAIEKLQEMRNNAYVANAGTNAKPYKILLNVKDMVDFLMFNESFGSPIKFIPKTNQSNEEFRREVLYRLNVNGIIAMKVKGWRDAWGHISLWDNDNKKFLDDTNYLTRGDYIEEIYFWKVEDKDEKDNTRVAIV